MYSIDYTHQFKKDLRKCVKRGLDIGSQGARHDVFTHNLHRKVRFCVYKLHFS